MKRLLFFACFVACACMTVSIECPPGNFASDSLTCAPCPKNTFLPEASKADLRVYWIQDSFDTLSNETSV
eukprot:2677525-Rhodomonas_salina.4